METHDIFLDDSDKSQISKHSVQLPTPTQVYFVYQGIWTIKKGQCNTPHVENYYRVFRHTLLTVDNSIGYLNLQTLNIIQHILDSLQCTRDIQHFACL